MTPPKLAAQELDVVRAVRRDGETTRVSVLKTVDLNVPAGEVVGVIGPSGSGKTTLLRALNALEEPSGGHVLLDGIDTREIEPTELRRRVGMVFQTPALFDETVMDNVSYGLRLNECSSDKEELERRAHECLSFVGLNGGFAARPARELSQGEQQRVSIARALAPSPEVVLMDEPTSALHPTATARILDLVRALRDDAGLTVVFVTHLMEQARAVCDRAVVLVEGRSVDEGALPELFEHPSSDLTRRFLDGRLEREGEE